MTDIIPPAFRREKDRILDLIYKAEDAVEAYREQPTDDNWRLLKSKIVSAYNRMRPKQKIAEQRRKTKRDKQRKYDLDGIEDFLFTVEGEKGEPANFENLKKWRTWLFEIARLIEDSGISDVSVEDKDEDSAILEGVQI